MEGNLDPNDCPFDFTDDVYNESLESEYRHQLAVVETQINTAEQSEVIDLREAMRLVENHKMEVVEKSTRLAFFIEETVDFQSRFDNVQQSFAIQKDELIKSVCDSFGDIIPNLKGHLQGRAFFSLSEGTISLEIKSESHNYRSVTQCSGGERSVCTIAFLRACSERLRHPIKCIDEFDVYQDTATRISTLKDLVLSGLDINRETGLFAHQTILVTPHEFVTPDLPPELEEYFRIIKLDPPNRES
ncbi:hypothetical protein GEMRC1_002099 [Eukaryota sp. GEM-RC1]